MMNTNEWILILFTILAQMSVGAFLVLGVVHYYAHRKDGVEAADRFSDRVLLAITPVMLLALVASLFHLGNPLRSYLAVSNLDSSWLSREVLSVVLFTVLGALFAYMQSRKIGSSAIRNVIAGLASIAGLFLIWSMSQVYMLEAQPVWNTTATPISFFTTTFLLGVLAAGAAFIATYAYYKGKGMDGLETQYELLRWSLHRIALAAMILVGILMVLIPMQVAHLASLGGVALKGSQMMFSDFGTIMFFRLALAFIGAGVFGFFVHQHLARSGKEQLFERLSTLVYSAFTFVLVAEVMGRYLFYATSVRLGI